MAAEQVPGDVGYRDESGEMTFDGVPVPVRVGQSVGAALTAAGIVAWRRTRRGGRPRGLFCGIGVCFDCLITIDGEPDQRACLAPARPGLSLSSEPDAVRETS